MVSRIVIGLKEARSWPWYTWLVTVYPILGLYSLNIGLVLAAEFWLALGVALAVTTGLLIVLALITRSIQKGAAMVSVLAIFFFSMGHIWMLAVGETLDDVTRVPEWMLPVWVAAGVVLAGLVGWRASAPVLKKAAPSLNLVMLGLVAFSSYRPIWAALAPVIGGSTVSAASTAPKVMNDAQHPDVYFIIMDGYSANKQLMRDYGYDNSDFTDELEKRGFYVAYDGTSNYGVTLASIASALNMRFLSEGENPPTDPSGVSYARRLISDSEMARQLQERGYTYIFMMSGWDTPSVTADYNMDFFYEGGMRLYPRGAEIPADTFPSEPFTDVLLRTTVFIDPRISGAIVRPKMRSTMVIPHLHPERTLHEWRQTARIAERPEATFTVVHMMKPHHGPLMFSRDGKIFTEPEPQFVEPYWFDQLPYLNEKTLAMVDQILAKSSVPPIIMIFGDHGSQLGYGYDQLHRRILFQQMDIYYFPNGGDKNLYQSISLVNAGRVMFNTYFGGNYELLPDDQHFEVIQGYTSIFHFRKFDQLPK